MTNDVHIAGVGARTPLGFEPAAAAAAIRAGISRLGEHPFMLDQTGEPMPGALDPELDPALFGFERLLRLAEIPLRDACAPLAGPRRNRPTNVYLALPEFRPGFNADDAAAIAHQVPKFRDLPIPLGTITLFPEGHAAGFRALAEAVAEIQAGHAEACLVGGVDSYFHPDTMEWLDANRQLAGSVSRSSFVPGEGAAFCLLLNASALNGRDAEPQGRIAAVSLANETRRIKTSDICLGLGLTEAIKETAKRAGLAGRSLQDIICDINGERYRTEEWVFVATRLDLFCDPTNYRSPADSWGDMGAASAPLFMMLACQTALRGYGRGSQALLWAGSENGLRGAAVLTFDPPRGKVRRGIIHA